ncbi:MAG: rRNA maturation RNase YbeY [Ginsengibacter sp.]
MADIVFINNGIPSRLTKSNEIEINCLINKVFEVEQFDFKQLVFIFSSDEILRKLNKKFLKHNNYTDILTFTLSEKNSPLVSEIYISIERVEKNALFYKVSYLNELSRVIIHGILHLCGYQDLSRELKKVMRAKENYYLEYLSFT